ncbi:hypothetical protein [Nocardiopsis sp. MG754419]|uniref:hypothetical protein n=1 Tax=Nocardiopsis sp. MG754419 TaxID=2259865 RepID=UPI001BA52E24|nr:hypothetical protein [Nocardiopsis sp. MG754419]MBR8744557.1 hypothetical protein [Nocardiopsis sp. MG754419]
MNEHATPPTATRRHPRAVFGRIQIYAQNNPRGYALRLFPLVFLAYLLPLLLVCLVLLDDWAVALPLMLAAVVPFTVIALIAVILMPRMMRRMLGTATLPPDTDPVDLLEAKRRLRQGGLHEREEVNRVARIVATQVDSKMNSPKTLVFLGLGAGTLLALWSLLAYLSEGAGADFWFRIVLAVVAVAYTVAFIPVAKRSRQRARDFAALYDSHHKKLREAA